MGKRKPLTKAQWAYIHSQEKVCVICKRKGIYPKFKRNQRLEIDHIIPVKDGGTNDISNLRWLCLIHNRHEAGRNIDHLTRHETFYFILAGDLYE